MWLRPLQRRRHQRLLQLRLLTRLKREEVWLGMGMGPLVLALRVMAIRLIALAGKWPVRIQTAAQKWKERTLLH